MNDNQNIKIREALTPLYQDADFSNVTDMNVAVTTVVTTPPPAEISNVDVPKPV